MESSGRLKIEPRYVVDERGRRKSVQLSIAEFEALIERLEELEDTLELDRAQENPELSFTDYSSIRERLRQTGRL